MSIFGPYTTGGTYWRFYYEVYDNGVISGNTHQVAIKFYLAHYTGSGNYYTGAAWNFNYAVNGSAHTYEFSGSGTVANSSDYSAKTQIGETQYVNVDSPNPVAIASISVSANMSERSGSVSPHYSYGGSGSINLSATATEITAPTLTVVDNGNNTVTMYGNLSTAGTNNPLSFSNLFWTINNDSSTSKYEGMGNVSGGSFSKTINILPGYTSIKADIACRPTYGTDKSSGEKSTNLKYYAEPSAPGKPVLTSNKSKYTLKSTLTWNWTAATAGNVDSPIAGYRLRLYKNGSIVTSINPNELSAEWLDTESTSTTFVVSQALLNQFRVGDTIKLGIYAYAKNGAGTQLFNGAGTTVSQVNSNEYKIQNAGVMHTKINGSWKEGQVSVKVNGSWKEATGIFVKVNGTWKEAQ